MKMRTESEDICHELRQISQQLSGATQRRAPIDDDLFSSITQRLADVEARLQKIESLITRTTLAGNIKLSDIGKEVARNWYQK